MTFLFKFIDTGELHVPFGNVIVSVSVELLITLPPILNVLPTTAVDGRHANLLDKLQCSDFLGEARPQ